MGRRHGSTGLELMDERPGFRATFEQREWLEDARKKAGASSLSEWLRGMAVEAGKKLLASPYPIRKELPPAPKKKSRR